MQEMKTHERFRAAAKGLEIDRLPLIEWTGWWDVTLNGWYKDNPALRNMNMWEIQKHFGLDLHLQSWFPLTTPETPKPEYYGGPIVTDEASYEKIKSTLYPEPKLSPEFLNLAKKFHEEGTGVVWFTLEGYFWFPRSILGIENHLYSFYDNEQLYHRICNDLMQWHKKVIEYCGNVFPFDFMSFAEDMSYNNGPMISKELFDKFMKPYYLNTVSLIKDSGVLTMVDSDGDITQAVDWFNEVGIEGMLPLERQAGVDVSLYIEKHPEMFFLGHYDKMVMDKGESAQRAEFERLLPSMVKGRFIPSMDHQTPPAASYQNYVTYAKLYAEYAKKAADIKRRYTEKK